MCIDIYTYGLSYSLFCTLQGVSEGWLTDPQKNQVVTTFKLRAYRYTQSIFAGPIYLPKTALPEISRAVADFTQRSHDAKLGMFLYVLKRELLESIGVEQDMLVVHAFDAHGEEHGRSDEGFRWALRLKGAIDGTKTMNLRGVADLQGEMFSQFAIRINQYLESGLNDLLQDQDSLGKLKEKQIPIGPPWLFQR